MTDKQTQRDRVRAEALHQQETIERLIAQAQIEGMTLDALGDDRSLVGSLTQLVRSRGNAPLAKQLQEAHDAFTLADDLRCGTAHELGADSNSSAEKQRAIAAKKAADDALVQLEQVIAEVRAFLEKGDH